jgi:serine phosphatase RsbU (regulator of sigma subunit)
MKIRFSIAWKIGTGFSILLLLTIIVFYNTNVVLNKSKQISDDINEIYNPSVYELEVLKLHLLESNTLITEWVNNQSSGDKEFKMTYINLVQNEIPRSKERIKELYKHWIDHEKHLAEEVFAEIDSLLKIHMSIRNNLRTWEDYEDPEAKMLSNYILEDAVAQLVEIDIIIQDLIIQEKDNTIKISKDMVESFDTLLFIVRYLGIALVLMGIIISIYTARSIVKPVNYAKKIILDLSKGIIEKRKIKSRNDEIGEMTKAMNKLIEGLNMTKDFANALGSGNYDFPYTLLSDEDVLGKDLLKMRIDLAETERTLEEKVTLRTAEVVKQKEEIEIKNEEIGRLYDEVTDSIVYAKRIQDAILKPDSEVKKIIPNSFIYFKPKDIVSGDFYWVEDKIDKCFFAASDCTGHGVPGAFMSIIGHNGLNQAVNFCETPAEILDALNEGLGRSLHQADGESDTKDGMDIAVCSIDKYQKTLQYAGAFNPLYLVRNGELIITKADKFPVGSFVYDEPQKFTNHVVDILPGDMFFICSDGYQDQFGGPKGKKFMLGKLKKLFVSISHHDVASQAALLDKELLSWKGENEQVDDILIIGLKINS